MKLLLDRNKRIVTKVYETGDMLSPQVIIYENRVFIRSNNTDVYNEANGTFLIPTKFIKNGD